MISVNWKRPETAPKDGTKILLFGNTEKERIAVLRIGWWFDDGEKSGWMTKPMPGRRVFEQHIVPESWVRSWKSVEHWNEEQDEIARWYEEHIKTIGNIEKYDLIGPKPEPKIEAEDLL